MKAKPLGDAAVRAAQRVLLDADVKNPRDIHVEAIAARHGAWVVYGPMKTARAAIVRTKDRAIVWVDERTKGAPWARFTVAHELGHHLLHTVEDHFEQCTGEERAGAAWNLEREANHFSTELLMPESLARPLATAPLPTLEHVEAFARTFRTSLMAGALRYVQLTAAPCAVVVAEEGRIKWASESSSFPGKVVQRRALHDETLAAKIAPGGPKGRVGQIANRGAVPGPAWGAESPLVEESWLLSSLPGVRSIGAVGQPRPSAVVSWIVAE